MTTHHEPPPEQRLDLINTLAIGLSMILSLALTTGGGVVIGLPSGTAFSTFWAVVFCSVNLFTWAMLRSAAKNFRFWRQLSAGARSWALMAAFLGVNGVILCWLADVRAVELGTSLLTDVAKTEEKVEGKLEVEETALAGALDRAQAAEETARKAWDRSVEAASEMERVQTSPPARRLDRKSLQSRLAAAGYDPGAIDGSYGPLTQSAVSAYLIELQGVAADREMAYQTRADETRRAQIELDSKRQEVKASAGKSVETQASEIVENQGVELIIWVVPGFIELIAGLGTALLKYSGAAPPRPLMKRRMTAGATGRPTKIDATGVTPSPDEESEPVGRGTTLAVEIPVRREPGGPTRDGPNRIPDGLSPVDHRAMVQAHFATDLDETEGRDRSLRGAVRLMGRNRARQFGMPDQYDLGEPAKQDMDSKGRPLRH